MFEIKRENTIEEDKEKEISRLQGKQSSSSDDDEYETNGNSSFIESRLIETTLVSVFLEEHPDRGSHFPSQRVEG